MPQDLGKTSLGLDPKMVAVMGYSVGWVTGIVFYLLESENKYVRFHAAQSMVVFGVFNILIYLPFVGLLVGAAGVVVWILLMVKAYQGVYYKLPFAGDMAEKYK
ncbi:MAG: hypothetical protein HQL26_02630 [Candidatus Omnitrophica bacterium]|nr:hypothetical protein [Candidatus Omnitrophota bacterium]